MPAEPAQTVSRPPARNLLGILRFLGRYPGRAAAVFSLLGTMIALELCLPQIIGRAIDGLRAHQATGAPFAPWHFAAWFGAIVLIREAVRFSIGRVRTVLIQNTLADIRLAFFDRLQRLAFAYHDKANTGELLSRGSADIWRLQEFLFACLFLGVDIVVSVLATTVLLFALSAPVGWATLGTMLPTVALLAYYSRRLFPQWRAVHDRHGEMTTAIQENIAGVRVVKAFAKEGAETEKFVKRQAAAHATLMVTVNYWASRVPFAQFVFGLGMPLVLLLGGREVIAGRLAVGALAKAVFYLLAIGYRVMTVGRFVNILQNAAASAERVLEIVEAPREITGGERALPEGGGAVRFDHVSMRKADGRVLLEDISFDARPGQTVAIVGATGSGKTTLAGLIARFYEATSGRVTIEGTDVRELPLDDLRRAVGIVFQETFLFSASVADNLAYGRPDATRAQVEAAARDAQADEFIRRLPQGYDTVIGERGVSLSGGQKQRLAIARALVLDPRIMIFDDATAAVDSRTERLIREAMRRATDGRTTFLIAHRVSTFAQADLVLVLEHGRLVEQGTPAELARSGAHFRRLFAGQLEGERRAPEPMAQAA